MTVETVTAVPDDVAWKVRPGDIVAHAFSAGPGWQRSCCREVRWTVAVQDPPEDATRCPGCAELVDRAAS